MSGVTELCGLRVSGALAPVGRAASGRAEMVMDAGRVTAPDDDGAPDGLEGHGRRMSVRQVGDVTFVRFHGLADAVLDMTAGTATATDVCPDVCGAGHACTPAPFWSSMEGCVMGHRSRFALQAAAYAGTADVDRSDDATR